MVLALATPVCSFELFTFALCVNVLYSLLSLNRCLRDQALLDACCDTVAQNNFCWNTLLKLSLHSREAKSTPKQDKKLEKTGITETFFLHCLIVFQTKTVCCFYECFFSLLFKSNTFLCIFFDIKIFFEFKFIKKKSLAGPQKCKTKKECICGILCLKKSQMHRMDQVTVNQQRIMKRGKGMTNVETECQCVSPSLAGVATCSYPTSV